MKEPSKNLFSPRTVSEPSDNPFGSRTEVAPLRNPFSSRTEEEHSKNLFGPAKGLETTNPTGEGKEQQDFKKFE